MRNTNKDKRIFSAVKDYFGDSFPEKHSLDKISLHITGRKQLHELSEEERADIRRIKLNMTDEVYMNGLLATI